MATADLVYRNFIYQLERLSLPTGIAREQLRHSKQVQQFHQDQSPADRLFVVYWDNSEENLDIEDLASRWNNHNLTIEVSYNADREIEDLNRLMLQDRNAMLTRLRNGDFFTGYEGASTADVGLQNRHFTGDEFDRDDPVRWVYRQRWRCTIEEIE